MQLGYLGPAGSYSYEAALLYSRQARPVAMKAFSEIIRGVEDGIIDEGILPIENSTEGAVTAVMDGLLKTKLAQIKGEVVLPVVHNLLGTGEKPADIRYVYSHPQAIEQCREFFQKNYPSAVLLPCESSSFACINAKKNGSAYGAIANTNAGEIYGLKTLFESVQDNFFNQTRFVILSREPSPPGGRDKTSIAFTFHNDRPGSLFRVLQEFAVEEINLTRIESRPAKAELGKYVFFIDFCGHSQTPEVRKILTNIAAMTNLFKILGSYPAYD